MSSEEKRPRIRITPSKPKSVSDRIRIRISPEQVQPEGERQGSRQRLHVTLKSTPDRDLIARAQSIGAGESSSWLPGKDLVRKRLAAVEKAYGLAPYRFQSIGVDYLRRHSRALLWDEMGLGKTVQALLAGPKIESAGMLVICPKSVQLNWQREAERWRPDLRGRIECLSRSQFRLPAAGELLIAKWGSLPKPSTSLDKPGPFAVVFDEAHYAKNPTAKRTKAARRLAELSDVAWVLTGTPLSNKPPDLWNVVRLAELQHCLGPLSHFQARFFSGGTDTQPTRASPELRSILQCLSLKRRRRDVLKDLPSIRFVTQPVEIEAPDLRRKLDEVLARFGGESELIEILQQTARAREFLDFQRAISSLRKELASVKLAHAFELVKELEAEGEPVVVFSCHRGPVDALGAREDWGTVSGSDSGRAREDVVQKFQRGELKGLAITTAAAEGITLTAAAILIRIDLYWNPGTNSQVVGRLCRIGQDRSILVMDLVADHRVDEIVYKILSAKTSVLGDLGLRSSS